jgi:3-dehydroquinate synthase
MSSPSRQLKVALGHRAYDIHIGTELLPRVAALASLSGRSLCVLTDSHLAERHLTVLQSALGISAERIMVLPAGEPSKTWQSAEQVLDWMLSLKLARDAILVALGGGVIGDMAGFCAAIYQRGIEFVQLPTTLLAMVDSSVGGKTGVNHPRGKNLIGAFHQPRSVIADLTLLKTLPVRELSAGTAEVLKYAMLGDTDFLAQIGRAHV